MINDLMLPVPKKRYGVELPQKDKPTVAWYLLAGVFLTSTFTSVLLAGSVDNLPMERVIGFALLSAVASFTWLLYYTPQVMKRNQKKFDEAQNTLREEYINDVLIPWLRVEHKVNMSYKKALKLYQGAIISVPDGDEMVGVKLENARKLFSYVEGERQEPVEDVQLTQV